MRALPLLAALLVAVADRVALAADDVEAVRQKLAVIYPDVRAGQISPSPIPGLFELRLGPQIAYVSPDGRFMVRGDIYDIRTNGNLTEARRGGTRLAAMDDISESRMVIFAPRQVKHTITVFTDIDCGYCRKLHREIDQYLAQGIRVRYLFYPRNGPGTESWHKAEQVWCSSDRNSALTKAKRGEILTEQTCKPTPVQQHYSLGSRFGVQGTPTIITDGGKLVPGYVSAAQMSTYLSKVQGS